MVVVKNFSVRLVEAETKAPFIEHNGPDGKMYAEAEPGVEYWIETEVVGEGATKLYYLKIYVDGQCLGYYVTQNKLDKKMFHGIYSYHEGMSSYRALRFQRPKIDVSKSTSPDTSLMGNVKIVISEAIENGIRHRTTSCKGTSVDAGIMASTSSSNVVQKKMLRSVKGSQQQEFKASTVYAHYLPGQVLETITIHYCAAQGLVTAGVLAKPPGYTNDNIAPAPATTLVKNEAVDVKPLRVKTEGVASGNAIIVPPKECDYFDMSMPAESGTKIITRARAEKENRRSVVMAPPKQCVYVDLTQEESDDEDTKAKYIYGRRGSLPRLAKNGVKKEA